MIIKIFSIKGMIIKGKERVRHEISSIASHGKGDNNQKKKKDVFVKNTQYLKDSVNYY